MRLRLKVLLILAVMWAIISLSIYIYSSSMLTNEYLRLEKKEVAGDLDQTSKTLYSLLSSLKVLNTDWSQWDDAYVFMKNKNQNFIKSNLAFTTFENAKINLILFFDTADKLFYGREYDLVSKKFVPISNDLLNYLAAEKSFTMHQNFTSNKVGIFKSTTGFVALSSLPILTSEGKGPSHGTIIMGFFFTEHEIEHLSELVNLRVDVFTLNELKQNPILTTAYLHLNQGEKSYIVPKDRAFIYGYTLLQDFENNPIGMLRITAPRDLYNQGISVINRYLAIILGVGVLFIIATWYLLKLFVLDRLVNVSKQVVDISRDSKFSDRIAGSGSDELDMMVKAINSLMEIIELTQEQLKYRIFLRTEELERLSNLNKNLYNEMTHQKEIEEKMREDEKVLRKMAYYDALTELPNRLFLKEMLQKLINKSERDGSGIAILFIDADRLKSINDTYGHNFGDLFLKHIANQLKKSIKESDIAARLAGDEFIVCLNNLKPKSFICKITEKILENMSFPLMVNGIEIKSTFSIGISIYPDDGRTIDELEKHADLAMYYAKKQPGNAFCFFDEIKTKTFSN